MIGKESFAALDKFILSVLVLLVAATCRLVKTFLDFLSNTVTFDRANFIDNIVTEVVSQLVLLSTYLL